jgi:hypothetical protein
MEKAIMVKADHNPIATSSGHKPATMTRRHFEGLARLLGTIADVGERERITQRAAEWCANSNPLFNPSRFRAAVASAAARNGWTKAAE